MYCFSQTNNVQGYVLHDQQPLAGASVSISVGQKTFTDSLGFFQFSDIGKGKHVLHVTMIGYELYRGTVTVTGDTKPLSINLMRFDAALSEVVVTGTLKPVQRMQSAIAVEVYSPQFFKKNPSPSIFEALQNVNGVRPQINCNVCNTGDIHINGLEGPYTMVTIDGMPIVSSLSSVYGLFGIPTQLIERVEIVKGPASTLYGSEAIGGLINIITKQPEKAPTFTANLMTTNWHEHNADVSVRWKIGQSYSLLGVNYFNYTRPLDKNNDNFTDATLQNRFTVFNKWSFQRKFNRKASLAARYFYEDRWGGEMQWNKKFRGTDILYGESIYTKRWEAIGTYQLPVQEDIFLSFSATTHDQNSYYGITPYMAKQKILFSQLTWNKSVFNVHDLLAGLATRYNYYDDNSTATIDTLTQKNNPERVFIPGIFLQDEWKLSTNHTLLFGVRHDYHQLHKSILTPRLAYKCSINEKQVFRVNAGTGFRVVNLFTEDHAALTGARAIEVRNKLKPEKSYNINLNYVNQFGSSSQKFNFDASVWYSYFHNQIIADYDTHPNKIIYDNLKGYAVSKGFTLNIDLNVMQRLKGIVGLTLQDVKKVEKNAEDKMVSQRPVMTERWSGTWTLSYNFPVSGIMVDYTGNIYGPMRLPLASSLDPRKPYSEIWSIQNLQITKWLNKQLELFAGVKNILNWTPAKNNPFIIARSHDPFDKLVEYDASGNVVATTKNPYALTFDPAYVYAPNQGRRIFAGVRFIVK
ncbi:MAG: TonB-dependent receptor domain-containing protein [Chitinophagaceae bacterium]